MKSNWIEFIGKNVPSSKNSKTWTGKILIKSKLCQRYIKWAEPLFKAQKDEWEKMKQEHTERPLMVGIYFYRDSKRKFDFNNVSQILCDMMTANDYIEDDNINEMVPVYLGHEVVKKEQSGVKLSIVNMEIWKDIPDYPKYQVSNMGNVRSLDYMHTGEIKNLHLETTFVFSPDNIFIQFLHIYSLYFQINPLCFFLFPPQHSVICPWLKPFLLHSIADGHSLTNLPSSVNGKTFCENLSATSGLFFPLSFSDILSLLVP